MTTNLIENLKTEIALTEKKLYALQQALSALNGIETTQSPTAYSHPPKTERIKGRRLQIFNLLKERGPLMRGDLLETLKIPAGTLDGNLNKFKNLFEHDEHGRWKVKMKAE